MIVTTYLGVLVSCGCTVIVEEVHEEFQDRPHMASSVAPMDPDRSRPLGVYSGSFSPLAERGSAHPGWHTH